MLIITFLKFRYNGALCVNEVLWCHFNSYMIAQEYEFQVCTVEECTVQ